MSANKWIGCLCGAVVFASLVTLSIVPARAQTLSFMPVDRSAPIYQPTAPEAATPDVDELAPPLRRQIVSYTGSEQPGTIIIDTAHTFLYLTLGGGRAMRYGIGVGRRGFTWSGVETISRKAEWPDWIPPVEMVARQPYLPRWVGGGPGNPLGARALYLGNSDYRIHGTNDPKSIGGHVSSGCIRLRDEDVIDLYNRVNVGTKVIVLPSNQGQVSDSGAAAVRTAQVPVPQGTERPSPALRNNETLSGIY